MKMNFIWVHIHHQLGVSQVTCPTQHRMGSGHRLSHWWKELKSIRLQTCLPSAANLQSVEWGRPWASADVSVKERSSPEVSSFCSIMFYMCLLAVSRWMIIECYIKRSMQACYVRVLCLSLICWTILTAHTIHFVSLSFMIGLMI